MFRISIKWADRSVKNLDLFFGLHHETTAWWWCNQITPPVAMGSELQLDISKRPKIALWWECPVRSTLWWCQNSYFLNGHGHSFSFPSNSMVIFQFAMSTFTRGRSYGSQDPWKLDKEIRWFLDLECGLSRVTYSTIIQLYSTHALHILHQLSVWSLIFQITLTDWYWLYHCDDISYHIFYRWLSQF